MPLITENWLSAKRWKRKGAAGPGGNPPLSVMRARPPRWRVAFPPLCGYARRMCSTVWISACTSPAHRAGTGFARPALKGGNHPSLRGSAVIEKMAQRKNAIN
ncbi:hypothetical protein [Acidovorax sp. SRB_14]|uniref:hypothetical protein n=1 Tax=Acidovorax sp. SRB_14 TaxID=1962699 RepID=UPI001C209516|nr:hypothetical protein [Acidovorax sp. SRB_14]